MKPLLDTPYIEVFSKGIKRVDAPLRNSPSSHDRNIYPYVGESKRGEASLIKPIPSPLHKGRGIKGEGLVNNLSGRCFEGGCEQAYYGYHR